MSFYETKHQYVTKSGEVRIYKYNISYTSKPKKYDGLKELYKEIINNSEIPRNEKVNKIYSKEKDNYTLEQIKNLIYRECKNESGTVKHKSYKPLKQKYDNILKDTSTKNSEKIKQIHEQEKNEYSLNSIKKFVYYYTKK